MFPLIVLAVAALTAAAFAVRAVRQQRLLSRVLARERTSYRLTSHCVARDFEAFHGTVRALLAEQAVLDEADRVVDAELAVHASESGDPRSEGGPV